MASRQDAPPPISQPPISQPPQPLLLQPPRQQPEPPQPSLQPQPLLLLQQQPISQPPTSQPPQPPSLETQQPSLQPQPPQPPQTNETKETKDTTQTNAGLFRRPTLFRRERTPRLLAGAAAAASLLRSATLARGLGSAPRTARPPPARGDTLAFTTTNNMLAKPAESARPSAWAVFSWAASCCCPAPLLAALCGARSRSSLQAWREKVALCWVAAVLSALVVFFLVFFNNLLCPANILANSVVVNAFGGVVVFGVMYNSFNAIAPYNSLFAGTDVAFAGIDVSASFEQPAIPECAAPAVANFAFASIPSTCAPNCVNLSMLIDVQNFLPYSIISNGVGGNVSVRPEPAYQWSDVYSRQLVVFKQSVLNLAPYFNAYPEPIDNDFVDSLLRLAQSSNDATRIFWRDARVSTDIINCLVKKYYAGILYQLPMTCILSRLVIIVLSFVVISIVLIRFFMALIFSWFLGYRMTRSPPITINNAHHPSRNSISTRSSFASTGNPYRKPSSQDQSTGIELSDRSNANVRLRARTADTEASRLNDSAMTIVMRHQSDPDASAAAPFRPSISLSPQGYPISDSDFYTVLFVTCYSEGEAALRMTLDSLAVTNYDDRRKILFIVADGLVKGAGNALSTPETLMRMMEHDHTFDHTPEAYSYVAVATGSQQHNMARVYCGTYVCGDHRVPTILVVKCGTPDEATASKPGNRGKRDSQLILMHFFSRVVINDRMTPLDYDIFRKMRHLTGITPDHFEIVLMVDADTRVEPDSLRYMINAMHNDGRIMGLCGETRIANKLASWVTSIQVFEYFISHHLGKAFESVFGGVTCLPGCFCMYRIKTYKDGMVLPILANPDVIEQYSTNEVYTLHQKNLLLLGEDRFLTTLMLRTFPKRRMVFVPQAVCHTTAPDDFKTLVSQRRRWINSTVHNLMELVFVKNLCGLFCFSMQFIVAMDLIGTAVNPVSLITMVYLIVMMITYPSEADVVGYISLGMLVAAIFLPLVLVVMTMRRLDYVLWFLVYVLALPVWQVVLPLYAFWHFDDFSWGETRKTTSDGQGGGGGDGHGGDVDGGKKPQGHSSTRKGTKYDDDDASAVFDGSQIPFKRWDEYEKEWRRERIRSSTAMYMSRGSSVTDLGVISGSTSSSFVDMSVPVSGVNSLQQQQHHHLLQQQQQQRHGLVLLSPVGASVNRLSMQHPRSLVNPHVGVNGVNTGLPSYGTPALRPSSFMQSDESRH